MESYKITDNEPRVGDLVIVSKKSADFDLEARIWNSDMDEYIGEMGTVTRVSGGDALVEFGEDAWWFPSRVLAVMEPCPEEDKDDNAVFASEVAEYLEYLSKDLKLSIAAKEAKKTLVLVLEVENVLNDVRKHLLRN